MKGLFKKTVKGECIKKNLIVFMFYYSYEMNSAVNLLSFGETHACFKETLIKIKVTNMYTVLVIIILMFYY